MQAFDFVYSARAARVVFGAGSLQHLEREVLNLNAERALILCSPQQRDVAEALAGRLGSRAAGTRSTAAPVEIRLSSSCGALAVTTIVCSTRP